MRKTQLLPIVLLSAYRLNACGGPSLSRPAPEENMESRTVSAILAVSLLSTLTLPFQLVAQNNPPNAPPHHHYKLIDMGTFGGPMSSYPILNQRANTVGWSATSTPTTAVSNPFICGGVDGSISFITVAFQFEKGNLTNLGALPGPD